jgi:hypothetical protein
MQHHTAGELAKPKNINALRVAAFWCGAAGGILSPAQHDAHERACRRPERSSDLERVETLSAIIDDVSLRH